MEYAAAEELKRRVDELESLVGTLLLGLTRGEKEMYSTVRSTTSLNFDDANGQVLQVLDAILENRFSAATAAADEVRQALALALAELDECGLDAPRHRFVDISLYVRDPDAYAHSEDILEEIEVVMQEFGLEVIEDFPAQLGSLWKRWIARTAHAIEAARQTEEYEILREALELHHLGQPQADIDERYARMAASIYRAFEDADELALKFGALLAVKHTTDDGRVNFSAVTLSTRQLRTLNAHPEILTEPGKAFQRLGELSSGDGP
jgi:enamine deaminase RidA (YjgF/YER057c/UK114 family)